MRQNKNTWFYIGGSGLDRTDGFQKFCGSGLDRIQFYRIRTGLGLKNSQSAHLWTSGSVKSNRQKYCDRPSRSTSVAGPKSGPLAARVISTTRIRKRMCYDVTGVKNSVVTLGIKVEIQQIKNCHCSLIQFSPEHVMLKSYDVLIIFFSHLSKPLFRSHCHWSLLSRM